MKVRNSLHSKEREELSHRVKEIRAKLNMDQPSFADYIGVSEQTIKNWEQCYSYPKLEAACIASNKLGCDINYFLGRTKEKTWDLKDICNEIGLSEQAVMLLTNRRMNDNSESKVFVESKYPEVGLSYISVRRLSRLICDEEFCDAVENLIIGAVDYSDSFTFEGVGITADMIESAWLFRIRDRLLEMKVEEKAAAVTD